MTRREILAEVMRRLKESRQREHHDKPTLRKSPFLHDELEGIGPQDDWETRFEVDPEVVDIDSRIYRL